MLWAAVIIISIIIEAITVELVSIWFALAGGIVLILEYTLKISQVMQFVVFVVCSIVFIILTRPISKKMQEGKKEKTNLDHVIGEECVVLKTITNESKGKTVVLGKEWSATSLNNEIIEEGSKARVCSISGNHLVLEKL